MSCTCILSHSRQDIVCRKHLLYRLKGGQKIDIHMGSILRLDEEATRNSPKLHKCNLPFLIGRFFSSVFLFCVFSFFFLHFLQAPNLARFWGERAFLGPQVTGRNLVVPFWAPPHMWATRPKQVPNLPQIGHFNAHRVLTPPLIAISLVNSWELSACPIYAGWLLAQQSMRGHKSPATGPMPLAQAHLPIPIRPCT